MNINMRILTDIICISACVYCIAYYTKCLIRHEYYTKGPPGYSRRKWKMNINMRILTDIICISACVYCIAYYTKCLIRHENPLLEEVEE